MIQGSNTYPPIIPGLESNEYPSSEKRHYRMSGAVVPARPGSSFTAEVLFNGTREWLVLVKPAGKENVVE